ncbi:MAG: hypothetical protein A2Y86_02170 [Candidatus Aminicenantes bacterium RBG_13_62_12]|nr:MAG: hypothetical protein A2Y86_02170 [Candidatus Aminicenantes bacterium RBG_13_62_12]
MTGGILVFRLGGLGDLLVTLPSLALLREAHPGAEFTLVCRESYGLLLKEAGLTESVVPADSSLLAGLYRDPAGKDPSLRRWLKSFATAWGWMSRESGAGLVRSLIESGARNVRILDPPPASTSIPNYEHFLRETAKGIGRPSLSTEKIEELSRLRLPGTARGGMSSRSAPPVIIHPGSGGRDKCWPLERFLEIAGRLSAEGLEGILVTGEAEERLEPRLEARPLPEGWSWLRRPVLSSLAEQLGRCRLYLGNDSGVTHLAAACGAPVLALFKKENAVSWRPYGNVRVVSAVAVEDIKLEDVWREIFSWKHAHG